MKTLHLDLGRFSVVLLAVLLIPSLLSSQSTQSAPAAPVPEDNLTPVEFTTMMKEAWTFLKDETDNYLKAVGSKTEFETTAEFDKRSIGARQQYLAKIAKFDKDKKFDKRVMGVLLKAHLDQFDADNQIYRVSCPEMIGAPYNLPNISTDIPSNSYVALADSIQKGYRTSSIYLKFSPYFRWQVARDVAKVAKENEGDIFFKVRFKIDMMQTGQDRGARFVVVPKEIQLMNQKTNAVYWDQKLR